MSPNSNPSTSPPVHPAQHATLYHPPKNERGGCLEDEGSKGAGCHSSRPQGGGALSTITPSGDPRSWQSGTAFGGGTRKGRERDWQVRTVITETMTAIPACTSIDEMIDHEDGYGDRDENEQRQHPPGKKGKQYNPDPRKDEPQHRNCSHCEQYYPEAFFYRASHALSRY